MKAESKVTALLSELQITNRPIKEDFCFDLESMKSEINYEKVYDVIEQNRQSSKQYLKDAIGMAKMRIGILTHHYVKIMAHSFR